jgi:cell wall-associated NlpC family hydrolase
MARPTHKITALRSFVCPSPSIKTSPLEALPFGATLNVIRIEDRMAITRSRGHVPAAHLALISEKERDFVAVAERFLGTPYLWGGKTTLGIDCSGLLQIALSACGVSCPRDSDMQEQTFGAAPERGALNLQRGTLLFWRGHVAIARDRDTLVHANAFHMAVVIEPAGEAIPRIRDMAGEITSVGRLTASP